MSENAKIALVMIAILICVVLVLYLATQGSRTTYFAQCADHARTLDQLDLCRALRRPDPLFK